MLNTKKTCLFVFGIRMQMYSNANFKIFVFVFEYIHEIVMYLYLYLNIFLNLHECVMNTCENIFAFWQKSSIHF